MFAGALITQSQQYVRPRSSSRRGQKVAIEVRSGVVNKRLGVCQMSHELSQHDPAASNFRVFLA